MSKRSRKNSLVKDIASHPIEFNGEVSLPSLLDDTYLFEKLQKLSLSLPTTAQPVDSTANDDYPLSSSLVETIDTVAETSPERYQYYKTYLAQLQNNVDQHNQILNHAKKIDSQFEDVFENLNHIAENTNQFVKDTKELHEKYIIFHEISESIPNKLKYFDILNPIMRRLNHAISPNIVKKDSFKIMLQKIDESLKFLESNPNFKESETYRIKFKQSLIRSCELIATFLKNILKEQLNEIMNQKSINMQSFLLTKDAFLYNKFASIAELYQNQIIELLRRTYDHNNNYSKKYFGELSSILNDCFNYYFQIRSDLLKDIIWNQLDETILKDKAVPLDQFIQANKSYIQELCNKEYNLFARFYPQDQYPECKERINQSFLQLCEPFYDSIRTRILRETNIIKLCDSLTLFTHYYEFEENSAGFNDQIGNVYFNKIFDPIVQKLQSRLIFRVQMYAEKYIIKYHPAIDVFKPQMISNKNIKKIEDESSLASTSPYYIDTDEDDRVIIESFINLNLAGKSKEANVYYPPLINTVALLSKINEMINSVIFDDLAHHMIYDCLNSIRNAYKSSVSQNSNDKEINLAYLKNLLFFKDQISNFNIQYTINETYLDFSGIESFFKSALTRKKTVVENDIPHSSLFDFARDLVPKVTNNMIDSRLELIHELRITLKHFIESVSDDIIGDTLSLKDGVNLLAQNIKLRENIESKFPNMKLLILRYITDLEVVQNLIEAIEQAIIEKYEAFYEEISNDSISNINKEQISEIMYVDVFVNFIHSITLNIIREIDDEQSAFENSVIMETPISASQENQYQDPNETVIMENGSLQDIPPELERGLGLQLEESSVSIGRDERLTLDHDRSQRGLNENIGPNDKPILNSTNSTHEIIDDLTGNLKDKESNFESQQMDDQQLPLSDSQTKNPGNEEQNIKEISMENNGDYISDRPAKPNDETAVSKEASGDDQAGQDLIIESPNNNNDEGQKLPNKEDKSVQEVSPLTALGTINNQEELDAEALEKEEKDLTT
ncbi:Golgi transport complex subunit COG3 NDAI_0C06010 [Naumovozyma dairenensis CBS 421]|uniref:Conserved oligomeric Golgi complex subunit 3 n=1 Tax=Naumovozyma dairenensis (strain ATCC 10597 / BCRC 20456 / CBS 421 / NBRC 0211 / NRRL Y-12639) TaxID=1071378 RepID=G0W8Z9_NAUDC|nr:hypothetical protein NDAI_0C06010 [Naumovozyma dairenensis CBS 421]CCD24260.1 hypothetical protein NDAI_0C06010 [Naumovozyma dairenensis CBS 421]